MPNYKLYYFNGKGFGEISRYLFAVAQQDYEDKRFGDDLKWEEIKPSAPYGRSPFLEIDGERFGQSSSIARYLANTFNLAGATDLEKLKADGIIDCLYKDLVFKLVPYFSEKNEEKKEALKKEITECTTEMYGKLEEQASCENTFLSSGLSWADVGLFNFHNDLYSDRFDAIDLSPTPRLKNILDNVASNEHIKNWIAKRPFSEG